MRLTKLLTLSAFVLLFSSMTVHATSPDEKASTDQKLIVAVSKASKAWKDAFNSGNAQAAASLYEQDATMTAAPFGTFKGREAIQTFWSNLVEQGFDDVVYSNTVIKVIDEQTISISADWRMNNAKGVITNELWVIQKDGSALLREDHFEVIP
ncbi:isochorismatase [Alteromonadaceae bacterium M269]|nr:isochorismatase [Alteromonadaceae bacterium M269]